MDLTDRIIEGLEKIRHLEQTDGLCNCGADEHNIKVTSLLKELK